MVRYRVRGSALEVHALARLLKRVGVGEASIDQGVQTIDFRLGKHRPTTPSARTGGRLSFDPTSVYSHAGGAREQRDSYQLSVVPRTRGNRWLEAGEVYAAAIKRLEREEDAYVRSGGTAARPFTKLVSQHTKFRVPWLFNDFDDATSSDDIILKGIVADMKAIGGSVVGRKAYLLKLVAWMMRTLNRVSYQTNEQTNLEMRAGAAGDCTELTRYAYAILRLAGFKPKMIFIHNPPGDEYRSATTASYAPYHQCVAVQDPTQPSSLIFVDLYKGGIVSEPTGRWVEMPKHTALASYHLNLGANYADVRVKIRAYIDTKRAQWQREEWGRIAIQALLLAGDLMKLISAHTYEEALKFDPRFPVTHYNYAHLLWDAGMSTYRARRHANEALRLMPHYDDARRLKLFL